MKQTIIIILLALSITSQAQTVYVDTISNDMGRLCADIQPINVAFLTGEVNASRITVGNMQYNNSGIWGTWYLEYSIVPNWYTLYSGGFSIPLDQTLTMYAERVPLFQYIGNAMELDNGLKLNILYK